MGLIAPKQYTIMGQTPAAALTPKPFFAAWSNLAAQNVVCDIAVAARSGVVWQATWGGVLAWDQAQRRVYSRYSSEHGLAGNAVACVCVDRSDRAWAGQRAGGLAYFDTDHWAPHPDLRDQPVRALTAGHQPVDVWIATERGLYYLPAPDQPVQTVLEDDDATFEIQALLADGDSVLAATGAGLFRTRLGFAPQRLAVAQIDQVVALARNPGGPVWVATPDRLFKLNGDEVSAPITPPGDVRLYDLAAAPSRVWVLTSAGLAYVDEQDQWHALDEALTISVSGEATTVLTLADVAGNFGVQIGTDRGLANVLLDKSGQVLARQKLLPDHPEDRLSNLGRCLARSEDGRIWWGTARGLIACQTAEDWLDYPQADDVHSLCWAGQGAARTLWMLAWPRGLMRYLPPDRVEPFTRQIIEGLPLLIAEGRDHRLYLLTTQGLWRMLDLLAERSAVAPPPAPTCLYQTHDAQWWLGTLTGLYRRVVGGGDYTWELIGAANSPRGAAITALAETQAVLWVATNNGLYTYRDGDWLPHPIDPQRPSGSVGAIAPAGTPETVWLASDDAVIRYQFDGTVTARYTPFDSGLADTQAAALLESDHVLWIATAAGLSCVQLA